VTAAALGLEADFAARTIGLQIQVLNASTSGEIDAAFATLVRERPDALFVGSDAFFNNRRVQLVHLASRHAVPAIYGGRDFAVAGGLLSYGADITDAYREVGVYAGSILKGAKPADLPVVQSSKFELVINHQTAAGHQPPDRPDARPRSSSDAARTRRRGDRIIDPKAHPLLRLLTTGYGPSETSGNAAQRSLSEEKRTRYAQCEFCRS
jgi:hypothetical protein